jgi:hypothetical protein
MTTTFLQQKITKLKNKTSIGVIIFKTNSNFEMMGKSMGL